MWNISLFLKIYPAGKLSLERCRQEDNLEKAREGKALHVQYGLHSAASGGGLSRVALSCDTELGGISLVTMCGWKVHIVVLRVIVCRAKENRNIQSCSSKKSDTVLHMRLLTRDNLAVLHTNVTFDLFNWNQAGAGLPPCWRINNRVHVGADRLWRKATASASSSTPRLLPSLRVKGQ